MFFLYTTVSYMIYVQPQISCTLPLKLFEGRKHLIVSDIIGKMTVERSVGHANTKLNTMQSTHIHVYIQTHKHRHIYTHNIRRHTHLHIHTHTVHSHTHTHKHKSQTSSSIILTDKQTDLHFINIQYINNVILIIQKEPQNDQQAMATQN